MKQATTILGETISYFFSQIKKFETFEPTIPYFEMLALTKSELENFIYVDKRDITDKLYDFIKNFAWPLDLDQQKNLFEKIKHKKYFLDVLQ